MSELKEYLCVEALDPYTKEIPGYLFKCAKYRAPQAEMELVYLKSEADNVIAELKKQVHDYAQCLYVMQARGEKESRHQKYKRCLAMAEACMHKLWRTDEGFDYARSHRHMNKWMELAEKFKEGK